ncbi:MAG: PucR family transcriptional regulator, partial [Coprobacillaceae bacterium]
VIPEMVYLIQKDNYQKALDENNNMIYIDYGVGKTLHRIVSSIRFEEKIVGYICVLLTHKKISEEEYEKVTIVTKFLSLYLSKHIVPNIPNNDFYLQNIFANDNIIEKDFTLKSNVNLSSDFMIAYTSVYDKSNEIVYLYQLFNHVHKYKDVYPILDDNHLFLLFTNIQTPNPNSLVKKQLTAMMRHIKVVNLHFGISNHFHTMQDVLKHKQQAMHAYELAKDKPYQFFMDIAIEDIFQTIKKQDTHELYLHPALQILKEYDKQHNSSYLYTLEIFIRQFCSSQETCQILNIHRNSLLYRLDKIQEISKLDLKSNQTRTLLLCNFYLYP